MCFFYDQVKGALMRTYKQITQEQRYQIYALLKTKNSMTKIAEVIGVHKSTISRELSRNRSKKGYREKKAHELAMRRRRKAKKRILTQTWALVEKLIRQDWSPVQVSGRLKKEFGIQISHEWIYQYILKDKHAGGDLYRHLRCQKKRRKRYGIYDRRGKIPDRIGIEERPDVINDRQRIGDWEVDTIFGRGHKQAIVTLTERNSRMVLLGRVENVTAQSATDVIVTLLTPLIDQTHSITSDNGKEFSRHQVISQQLEADFYFAHPYAAWERGTNENMNGLLRQYFPKKCDLTTITDKEIHAVMHKLNNRPRKCLDFRTPLEVFFNQPVALKS
jgi:IS30 family transposase